MELNVKIHSIGETQNVTDTFSKREFIVETQEEYKQHLLLQVIKDKCTILNDYKKGDDVTVSLNLKGKLWTDKQGIEKCFNTLECWKINKVGSQQQATQSSEPIEASTNESDLPF